ncbi:hypothetical protein [Pseudomonas sp. PMCC200344]|uniref:hypothetical protein n=1 Tax=Pseudomonas sp. PMCC200344 TaxID=3042028 RepID=UPI0024B323F0|nr:hypothetical protein [Pseudomonas sp. PMCC200344]
MTTQSNGLPAPELKEAEGGVVYLDKIKGDAHGIIPRYSGPLAGDQLTFKVDCGTTTLFNKAQQVLEGDSEQSYVFSIPKTVLEKVHASGAEAELHYILIRFREFRLQESQILRVTVKK